MIPMVNPNTIDLMTEEKISRKVIVEKPLLKKLTILVASFVWTLKYEPINATKPQYNPNIGTVMVEASTRVVTRYLNGFIADTSIASICSVTFMEPNSAPMLEPTFPAQINAVTNDPNARTIAMEIKEGNQEVAPNSDKDGLDCFVKTIPVTKPVSVISGSDFTPIS